MSFNSGAALVVAVTVAVAVAAAGPTNMLSTYKFKNQFNNFCICFSSEPYSFNRSAYSYR